VNYDETRICIGSDGKMKVKRLVSKKKVKPQFSGGVKFTHSGTFLPFISATGEIIATYFIFSSKFNESATAEVSLTIPNVRNPTRSAPIPYKIIYTESGYITNEAFTEIMENFCQAWKEKHPGLNCLCIGDNLAAHRHLKILKNSLDNGVFMSFLVANTSHWSQPLDNLLFARLKQEISLLTNTVSYLQIFSGENLFSLIDIVLKAAGRAFTTQTVVTSFKKTGLVPFSSSKLKKLAKANHPQESDLENEEHLKEHEKLVADTTKSVEKVFRTYQKESEKKAKGIKKVKTTVRKNQVYDAVEILKTAEVEQEMKEKEEKKRKEEKKKKADEKKRKREEEEDRRERKKQVREARTAENETRKQQQVERRKANTCQAKCGRTC
jgi:hypothetical protein